LNLSSSSAEWAKKTEQGEGAHWGRSHCRRCGRYSGRDTETEGQFRRTEGEGEVLVSVKTFSVC
jgi:hypothetical protein